MPPVKEFMQANGVRAGQLAIAKNGVFKARRAYTWADADYRVTEIAHLMRVASCQKMFTCACIQRLYDAGTLKESDKIFAKLGITSKALSSQTIDNRVKDITVEHCVDHEGGWDSSTAGDWIFKMRKIAIDLGLSGPVTKHDILRYCYGEPLQFKPGSKSQYSNLGYTPSRAWWRSSPERPTRTTCVTPSSPPMASRRSACPARGAPELFANEVRYDEPNVWWSAEEPTKEKLMAYCYGGEGWITEAMDGSGGLCATAEALVQFIRLHAVWGRGGRMAGFARTGSMAGVSSRARIPHRRRGLRVHLQHTPPAEHARGRLHHQAHHLAQRQPPVRGQMDSYQAAKAARIPNGHSRPPPSNVCYVRVILLKRGQSGKCPCLCCSRQAYLTCENT